MRNLSERLKNERKRLGFTQKQIAEKIGISEPSYNRYEKYSAPFDVNVVLSLHDNGFDMMYVLFDVRQVQETLIISDDFLKVFTLYNQLDKNSKQYFIEMAELFLKIYKQSITVD